MARGCQLLDSHCCRTAPTCEVEVYVTRYTLVEGEGCTNETADAKVDLADSKAVCISGDQVRVPGLPDRASVRGRSVLATPGRKPQ